MISNTNIDLLGSQGLELARLDEVAFHFDRQPDPVPPTLRPERRVPLLLLLVAKSYGAGAGWKGLQLLSWLVRNPGHADLVTAFLEERDIPDRPVVRIEPALDRALDIAVGLGFIERKKSGAYRLTGVGRGIVDDLEASDAFETERDLLGRLDGKVTQKEVARLLEWRDG